MNLTYKEEHKVYLSIFAGRPKHVGTIKTSKGLGGIQGFQYFPKGQKSGGDVYPTLRACQLSLEG